MESLRLRWPTTLVGCFCLLLLLGCGRPATAGVLAEYRRTGGVAGLDDRLTVYADGRALLVRRGQRSDLVLTQGQLNSLAALLEGAEFRSLKRRYSPERSGYDLLEYEVRYKGKAVRMSDGAVPPSLEPLLDELNEVIRGG